MSAWASLSILSGITGTSEVLGIPVWGQIVFLAAAVIATCIAGIRLTHYRRLGNHGKAKEFRYKVSFGFFITVLVAARFFVFHR